MAGDFNEAMWQQVLKVVVPTVEYLQVLVDVQVVVDVLPVSSNRVSC